MQNIEKKRTKQQQHRYGIIDDAIDNAKIESLEERERREREATEANLELLKTQNRNSLRTRLGLTPSPRERFLDSRY